MDVSLSWLSMGSVIDIECLVVSIILWLSVMMCWILWRVLLLSELFL